MNYETIENRYKDIIEVAKDYMSSITDPEHDINHMNDVVRYTKELLDTVEEDINKDVCILSAYWHDVGRAKVSVGHEILSAEMLKEEMKKHNYDDLLITNCYQAIENHKWDMLPTTKEGWIIKDADKLAWLGKGRWKSCLHSKYRLDTLISLLPKLKSEILYFEESKKIYDRDIVHIVTMLYDTIYEN